MDSLKARVFALALPAIGLIVSGSAVDATATETNETVAVADGFAAIENQLSIRGDSGGASSPGSLTFVQRMPAADAASVANLDADQSSTLITKLPPVEAEHSVGEELPPVQTLTAFAPQQSSTSSSTSTNAASSQRLPIEESGKMVIDSTPPNPYSASNNGALVSYDEPVIHVVRRESAPSMKREFYNDQLAAFAEKSQQAKSAPSRATEYVADARGTKKSVQLALRQPGSQTPYTYPVTSTGAKVQSVVATPTQTPIAKSELADKQPAPPAPKPEVKTDVVAAKEVTKVAATPAQPRPEAKVGPNSWTPVDFRNVNVSQPVASEPELFVSQATTADKAQAQHAVQLGFELIQRRAHYSARARFIQALRIVARSLDDQTFTTRHTSALRKALAAYDEAVDFYPTSAKPDEDVNLYMILGGHKTPVLAKADATRLTPRQCVREYMAYAEQEFTLALGNDGFASQALYGLGRLEASKETASTSAPQVRANRSLMLYQTAMLVDQRNYAAANELGVLLAKYGKYDNAIAALQHCVKYSPEPTAWKNLANIYHRVGNHVQANVADTRAAQTAARRPGTPFVANQPRVEWVKPDAFVAMNANSNMQVTRAANTVGQAQAAVPQQAAVALPVKKSASRKGLWPFGSK